MDDWFPASESDRSAGCAGFSLRGQRREQAMYSRPWGWHLRTHTFTSGPCWQEALPRIVRVQNATASLDQFKGLKIHVRTNAAVDTNNFFRSEILSDFWLDRIGDDYKIVAANLVNNPNNSIMADNSLPACHDVDRNAITQFESSGLVNQTLARFGLSPSDETPNVHRDITLPGNPSGAGLGFGQGNGSGGVEHAGGVYTLGGRVTAPEVIHSVEAQFSDEARRAKYQGICIVGLIVDAQGNPQNIHVVRPLEHGLSEKAIEAVRQYKFKPAMLDGVTPVPVSINIQIDFRLY